MYFVLYGLYTIVVVIADTGHVDITFIHTLIPKAEDGTSIRLGALKPGINPSYIRH